jgi:hypothetical protein
LFLHHKTTYHANPVFETAATPAPARYKPADRT